MTEHDWRLQGQEKYLAGLTLAHREWRQTRPNWDHDHCEFCWATFGGVSYGTALRAGWTTPDEYRWICDVCFADFKDRFGWQIDAAPN